jgi:hypothetical protein
MVLVSVVALDLKNIDLERITETRLHISRFSTPKNKSLSLAEKRMPFGQCLEICSRRKLLSSFAPRAIRMILKSSHSRSGVMNFSSD